VADEDDYAGYGIDWDALDDRRTREHHDGSNAEDGDPMDPFVTNQPDRLSHVEVEEAQCPFERHEVEWLDAQLDNLPHRHRSDMHSHRLVWIDAMQLVSAMTR
jgi:hypothetical protein